ncbi:pyridoxine/pyridoxamine 5'-phosphate oxidase [Labedella endophytica]|uniref:Oxidase n=1 Tax=Labedella endophytica TaxID=1523160 RepID=A0A433JS71_9MICO|nr:pyridoxamine 5'-phosphate oxidase family protein [Labedella endophytica]RUR01222.1 oxidase [Labedella endophytica]
MTDAPARSFRDVLRDIPTRPTEMPPLRAADAPADPLRLLRRWLEEESERQTPVAHAFALATVSPTGIPQVRTVILKDLDDAVWFATPSTSAKGQAISNTPIAEASFYWASTGRQMRLRGFVEAAPREVSKADFTARHPKARAGVIIGRQGLERDDPAEVERLYDEALATVEKNPDQVPEEWTAYCLIPDHVDVVQLRPASDGERIDYSRPGKSAAWTVRDLWP